MASPILFPLLALLAALGGGYYQFHLKGLLTDVGVGRTVVSRNTETCSLLSSLPACEKIVLHQPTGHLFAACSTPASRRAWTPALHFLNASARARDDYVAVLDPASGGVTRLALNGLDDARGLNTHGMDVVPSARNPAELFVYLVNQRPRVEDEGREHAEVDASVEVFSYIIGGHTLTHVRTYSDSTVMRAPNDVVGSPSGSAFWFTDDGTTARGWRALLRIYTPKADTHVGYCSVDKGCKIAAGKLPYSNGIARGVDGAADVFYVASSLRAEVRVLERQADESLVVTDVIKHDMPIDNLSVDKNGAVWGAGFPQLQDVAKRHFLNSTIPGASTALRIKLNTGRSAFFGEKYKVDKVIESDGVEVASGTTTVVYDAERGRLFFSGLMSPGITVCDLPAEK